MAVYLDAKACWLLFLLLLLISVASKSQYPKLIYNPGELERPGNHKVGICPEIRPARRPFNWHTARLKHLKRSIFWPARLNPRIRMTCEGRVLAID